MEQLTMRGTEREQKPQVDATGIPRQMKLDFEARSGLSFDDVRVHYNSDRPAAVGALAYTQGTQVYLRPGQERHLGHELGHVVQQKLGRVRPTTSMAGLPVNDDPRLEREADAWAAAPSNAPFAGPALQRRAVSGGVIQKHGERAATESTISSSPIRRGNRRGSICETGGKSAYLLHEYRMWFNNFFQNQFLPAFPGKDDLMPYVRVEVVKNVKAANCGEFAGLTFSHLVQNTRGQWVYKCHMANDATRNFDHAFTITSQQEFGTGLLPADADLDGAFVVDAWNNYQICTLRQFCDRKNPYGEQLQAGTNVYIDLAARADNTPRLTARMQRFIKNAAEEFLRQRVTTPQEYAAVNGFDFDRGARVVDDIRPKDIIVQHLHQMADAATRHKELDQFDVHTLGGEILPYLPQEQCAAYLRFLWAEGKTDRMGEIMNDVRNVQWVRDFINALPSWRFGLTKAKASRLLTNAAQQFIAGDFA